MLPKIQRGLNNGWSTSIAKTPNEVALGFTPATELDLLKPSVPGMNATRTRLDVADSIAFAQMNSKFHYDRKHQPMSLAVGDYALLRLHKGYSIPSAPNRKLDQQYVGPFRVTEKIGLLAYRLDIPREWRIHPVFSITQLEPCPCPDSDPFVRPRPYNPGSVYVEGDTDLVKSFEVERLISKRQTKRRGPEYLLRWKGYGPEHDAWRNIPELGDAAQHLKDYEEGTKKTTTLDGQHPRLNVSAKITSKKAAKQPAKRNAKPPAPLRKQRQIPLPLLPPASETRRPTEDTTGLRWSERLRDKRHAGQS